MSEGPRAYLPPGVPVSAFEDLVAANRRLLGLPPQVIEEDGIRFVWHVECAEQDSPHYHEEPTDDDAS